jgi:hypothetical protein
MGGMMYRWKQTGFGHYHLFDDQDSGEQHHVATLQPFLGYWQVVCRVAIVPTSKAPITVHEIPSVSIDDGPPLELALGLFLLSWEG